jgi:hypothetical protein
MLRSAGKEALHELGLAAAYSAFISDNSKAEPWTAVLLSSCAVSCSRGSKHRHHHHHHHHHQITKLSHSINAIGHAPHRSGRKHRIATPVRHGYEDQLKSSPHDYL